MRTASKGVLVAGAGPSGLAAAIELSRFKIPFRLIDKSPEPARWSQALVVQTRTLEQFERYGIASTAVEQGTPLHRASIRSDGELVLQFDFDRIQSQYPFVLFLPQSQTERLLTDHLHTLGGQVERQVELISVHDADGGVEAGLRHPDGQQEIFHSRWLIGCDGAHSTVRNQLGIPFEGRGVSLAFFLGDLELSGPDVPGDELCVYL